MKSRSIRVFILLGLFLVAFSTRAQVKYYLIQDKSTLQVEGTSTIHDWEMDAGGLKCDMLVTYNEKTLEINEVNFSCPAKMILSDNSIMDGKTHDAVKADKYPVITFKMKSIESFKETGSNFSGVITGIMNIAGVPNPVRFSFSGTFEEEMSIQVKGVVPLKMSDFKIDPPTAMFGALKTGNEIKLNYNFHFKKTS